MHYFDAHCYLGRFNAWHDGQPIDAPGLLRVMDHYGIHEALVVDALARENHPAEGNGRVFELTGGHPRLHPAWAALPPASRELPPPGELVAAMAARDVRAIFLYPGQYRFTLDDWCVDRLLGPLAERRVPVFICPNALIGDENIDLTDWPGIVRLCRAFPALPVVISESRVHRDQRLLYQALEACPNLHVLLTAVWHHRIVEYICREWGAGRLLFSAGLPARDPGLTLGQLNYAEISEAERAAIAGGTLRRLLTWGGTLPAWPEPAVAFPPPLDELHALARDRKPLSGQGFCCCHGHLGLHNYVHVADGSVDELLAQMDHAGVEHAVIFPNSGMNSDETYGNDLVIQASQAHPDRFIGFALVNLNRAPEEMRRELERCFKAGLRGIKIHAFLQNCDTNGPAVETACAFAHDRRAFIVNHYWGGTERIRYLCLKYPAACFITGHAAEEAVPILRECPNLYIGTSALTGYGMLEWLVAKGGADRILFGSDLSWSSIPWGLGPILYARIPPAQKRLILGGNLRRLVTTSAGSPCR